MHFKDRSLSSADWKNSVLVTTVVPSPWSKAEAMAGPSVRLSPPTFHVISAAGRDWAVQFASVTPEDEVTRLTSGLGKTGERERRCSGAACFVFLAVKLSKFFSQLYQHPFFSVCVCVFQTEAKQLFLTLCCVCASGSSVS